MTDPRAERGQRFTIDPADGWTECECPDALCTHDGRDGGPTRMRPYRAWTVWDNERQDHAFITVPEARVDVEYERKRDAIEACKRAALYASSTRREEGR